MSRIGSKGTKPEVFATKAVRAALRGTRARVKTNVASLPGKLDIVVGVVGWTQARAASAYGAAVKTRRRTAA